MGLGRDLGLQLREWIRSGLDLSSSPALTNRLMDALGAEPRLRAPLRDLAAQPLTLRALRLRGAEQQAALQALCQVLAETYNPHVLAELLDLLEAATGQPSAVSVAAAAASPVPALQDRHRPSPHRKRGWRSLLPRHPAWEAELVAIAPGLLAGFTGALVLAWGTAELDRWTFERIGWSSGAGLASVLLVLQLLSMLPRLRFLPRLWLLDQPSSADPHRIWAWISAPWMHRSLAEATLNSLLLLIVLGATPLGAGKLVLRYLLTCLACQVAAVLVARHCGVERRWGGGSAAIAALISLAASLSLLQAQERSFGAEPLSIPAWVLLAVNAGLQLRWQLPRQSPGDNSQPIERLWSSPWWWGTLGGMAWGLITRAGELIGPLLRTGSTG